MLVIFSQHSNFHLVLGIDKSNEILPVNSVSCLFLHGWFLDFDSELSVELEIFVGEGAMVPKALAAARD
jgi:hypothetical protein